MSSRVGVAVVIRPQLNEEGNRVAAASCCRFLLRRLRSRRAWVAFFRISMVLLLARCVDGLVRTQTSKAQLLVVCGELAGHIFLQHTKRTRQTSLDIHSKSDTSSWKWT